MYHILFLNIYLFKHLYWSIIALQWCVSFCCITVSQLYVYIYPHIPSLLRLPPTLPIPPLYVAVSLTFNTSM